MCFRTPEEDSYTLWPTRRIDTERDKAERVYRSIGPKMSPPAAELVIELDIFEQPYEDLVIAEVEFETEEEAEQFQPPSWFDKDVTMDRRYHNSYLSQNHANQLS